MEVLVKYENGFRFSAICKGYTVTTGRGEDGDKKRDGMWPAQLFGEKRAFHPAAAHVRPFRPASGHNQ